ncbi:uncharacterized protein DUF4282 [Roseimicrobium gellanilyticum]|uniref:Uncharacterized protein DUF4282 n=1 Tax=Roseimicrobium gellanilyticum TaxID=748857 RepID=A0A366HP44_9BACT|nr:DUF4282 domain-containing protein [Roseimicrobium gellanilyticum]RBP45265.1 uncharacterized protein DUF4282 [Roseimicrobium gellanilyticum]
MPLPMDETNPQISEARPEEKKDILDALLDLSFRTAITPKIARWLYIMGLVISGLLAARWVLAAFSVGQGGGLFAGVVAIFFAPILFVIYALITRVALEVVLAVFSIAESLKNIERRKL